MIKLTKILPNPNNPRLIKDDRFKKLVNSIKEFPKMMELRPMVVDENFITLGGNMRLKALKDLGYKEIPDEWVKQASDLTPEESRRFIIADNVGFGEHDWEMLANEWDIEELNEWGLDIPNFELDKIEAEDDGFDMPEEIKTDIVLGDFFLIGPHKLLCGSSTEIDNWAKVMEDKLADLVVTDPPYNVAYVGKTKDALTIENDKMSDEEFYKFLLDFYTALAAYTRGGGGWYVWHADSEGANFRRAMKESGLMVKQCLIWVKNSMVMGRQDYQWKHEPCLYGWKEGAAHSWYSDRKQTTILEFNKPFRNAEHPTMKPIELISYQINNSSKQGDIVADAFLGSGTTMIASHQTNRICYGMELDPKYCQVIIDRMKKLDPSIEIKRNGIIVK
jgi:site-specific DNA-methyltransferase (adenine-specific)